MRLLPAAVMSAAAAGTLLTASIFAADRHNQTPLIAHEWGTFTSIAAADGRPDGWDALANAPDLPCFVPQSPVRLKKRTVRMETQVLSFYPPHAMKISVDVNFPLGRLTQWYPKAMQHGTHLTWNSVQLTPGENPPYPTSQGASRYYAARNTDAAPLSVGGEREKMLFYRGSSELSIPLRPRFTANGAVDIHSVYDGQIPIVILFENRGGKIGYRVVRDFQNSSVIEPPLLDGNVADIRNAIVTALIGRGGLYPKEALAMLDAWQDSWFEKGMRLIYLLPQRTVDAVLPLTIDPAPVELTRAFIGRIELLSPAMRQDIASAAAAGDADRMLKYGRFLDAFALQVSPDAFRVARQAIAKLPSDPAACIR